MQNFEVKWVNWGALGKNSKLNRDILWYLRSNEDVKEIINLSIFSAIKLTELVLSDFLERG